MQTLSPVWRLRGAPLVGGKPGGPLAGVQVAVKDLFAVEGFAIGAGCPAWLNEAPVEDFSADAVRALLDAGADVVGIAQTDELAFGLAGANVHYGTPPNPAAPGRLPGGSSSGPGSAVALGEADVGLGTDTAGSIRVPASYLGLFGMRPTHGAVSTNGLLALAPRFDTVGWMTRDAPTLARVGEVFFRAGSPRPVQRALLGVDCFELATPAVAQSCLTAAMRLCRSVNVPVTEVAACDGQLESWFTAFRTVQLAQIESNLGDWVRAHPGALGPDVAARFADAAAVTGDQRTAAEGVLQAAGRALHERLPDGTVLLLPATRTPAPPTGDGGERQAKTRAGTLRLNCIAALAGLPALTVPTAADGCPVGLSVVGGPRTDRRLLELAGAADIG